jgi:hypothetical protein
MRRFFISFNTIRMDFTDKQAGIMARVHATPGERF